MNTYFSRLLSCAWLILALPLASRSQTDTPTASPAASSATQSSASTSTSVSTAAAPTAPEKPAAVAPPAPAPTPTDTGAPATAAPASEASHATESAATSATTTSTSSLRTLATAGEPDTAPTAPSTPDARKPKHQHRHGGSSDNARVTVFGNSHLNKNEVADAVIAIGGNSESEGEVQGPVVAIAGNAKATGPVDEVVVAVLGNAYVDSRVGKVVAVLGNVELGPKAEVMEEVVSVGGEVHRDPSAIVHGNVQNVGIGHFGFHIEWLQSYLTNCVLKGRPLAIAPHLAWAWFIALGLLGLYLLMALLFGRTVERNCETLEQNPGASVLAALLTLLLTPVLIVLLCVTVVGIAVIPFLAIGLFLASIFGRVVMLAWLGRRVMALTGKPVHPVLAVLVGGIVMLALYLVPFFGFIIYKATGVLGLGVVVYSLILSNKREKAARAAAVAASMPPVVAAPAEGASASGPSGGFAIPATSVPMATAAPTTAIPPLSLAAMPRAGFWIRLGAMLIDVILVGIVAGIFNDHAPHILHRDGSDVFLVLLGIYTACLWKLKGTTIGGIVCGLRVVRTDGREIDWATAVVRTIAYYISAVVAFLGFIWVAFDDEKQSWHDKIAGTTVVHHRGHNSLV